MYLYSGAPTHFLSGVDTQSGGQLLFHLISRLYKQGSVIVTTNWRSANGPACSATPR
jgi:hypothetical protein